MQHYATIFEAIMIFCFGISWPFAVARTLRTRNVAGVSIVFLWFVFAGYVAGILFKLSDWAAAGHPSPVMALYLFNFMVVGIEVVLYYRFRKPAV